MQNVIEMTARQRFDQGIITTFGKLDAVDIEKVDGKPDRLVALLMKRYDWSSVSAQYKVDQLLTRISNGSL